MQPTGEQREAVPEIALPDRGLDPVAAVWLILGFLSAAVV
jgi:hypothetical protein